MRPGDPAKQLSPGGTTLRAPRGPAALGQVAEAAIAWAPSRRNEK